MNKSNGIHRHGKKKQGKTICIDTRMIISAISSKKVNIGGHDVRINEREDELVCAKPTHIWGSLQRLSEGIRKFVKGSRRQNLQKASN